MAQNDRPRGRLLSWIGGVLLLIGGLVACNGGMSEMGCGDLDAGYDQCKDDAASGRTGGLVVAALGLGLVVIDVTAGRSR